MRLVVRRVEDRQFRCERRHLLRRWLAEHVAREQTVPGALADHADLQLISRIGTGDEVLYVNIAALKIREHL